MDSQDNPFFNYNIGARNFLKRARENLQRFDNGDVASLFYAALDLRFGIEARLYEYIDPVFNRENLPSEDSEYVATRLLKILENVDSNATQPMTLTAYDRETNEPRVSFEYTPVTKELARMHGKLGGMLHYNFFKKNTEWLLKIRIRNREGKSLVDFRAFLEEVVTELGEATRGSILGPVKFTGLIKELIEERKKQG